MISSYILNSQVSSEGDFYQGFDLCIHWMNMLFRWYISIHIKSSCLIGRTRCSHLFFIILLPHVFQVQNMSFCRYKCTCYLEKKKSDFLVTVYFLIFKFTNWNSMWHTLCTCTCTDYIHLKTYVTANKVLELSKTVIWCWVLHVSEN